MLNNEHSIPMKEVHLEREALLNIEQSSLKCSESHHFYTVPLWHVQPSLQHVTLTICGKGTSALACRKAHLFVILIGAEEVEYMLIWNKSRGNLCRDTMNFLCNFPFV